MRMMIFLAALLLALPGAVLAAYEPTAEETESVASLTAKFFDAIDHMDYDATYAMLALPLRKQVDKAGWTSLQKEARSERGAPRERVQRLLSWEADPPDAPAGLYVSVDLDSVHDVAKHMSEYVVWYRAPGAKDFQLLRHETTEMRGIVKDQGGPSPHGGHAADADAMPAATATAPATAPATATAPLPATGHPSPHSTQPGPLPPIAPPVLFQAQADLIGFKTVAEAREALAKRAGAQSSTDEFGWTVISESRTQALWSFVPQSHPAYPAVVRRQLVERDSTLFIDMEMLCEAKQPACDALEREFEALNARAKDEIVAARKDQPKA